MPLLINGQPFEVPQGLEIDESSPYSLTPISGGTKVQWNSTEFEIISGTNPTQQTIQTLTPCQLAGNPVLERKYYPNGGSYMASLGGASLGGSIGQGSVGWFLSLSNCLGASNRAVFSRLPVSCDGFCYTSQSTTGGINLSGTNPIYTVSNGTNTVWKQQANPPTISFVPASCNLIINYANGSQSPVMEFEECPIVEIIPEDFSCPDACSLINQFLGLLL